MVATPPGQPGWFHRTTISLAPGRSEGPTSRSSATSAPPWRGLRPAVPVPSPTGAPAGRPPPAAAGNRDVPHVGIDVSRDGRLSRVIPICCLTQGRPEAHRVSQGTRSQPWRDRRSRLPRGHRARRTDGRGLPARGPQERAPPQGRRGLRDRRAGAPGPGLPRPARRSSASPSRPAPTRSTPATASSRRTRAGRGLRRRRASRSSARRADVLNSPATRPARSPPRRQAGLPPCAAPSRATTWTTVLAAAADIGFPIFVKAVAGGGGRGMRRVERRRPCASRSRPRCARRRRRSATPPSSWSRPSSAPATSRCRSWPTRAGNVIHLFERDCSVQRRHQKVIEIAPAPNLDPELRERMCADAVAFAREIGYVNAGTVEFLLDPATAATSSSR